MIAEPKEFYDQLRHQRAQKEINAIGDDACLIIGQAMGWTMSMVSNMPKAVRQKLHETNDETLEAETKET